MKLLRYILCKNYRIKYSIELVKRYNDVIEETEKVYGENTKYHNGSTIKV